MHFIQKSFHKTPKEHFMQHEELPFNQAKGKLCDCVTQCQRIGKEFDSLLDGQTCHGVTVNLEI